MKWRDVDTDPPKTEQNAKLKLSNGATCLGFIFFNLEEEPPRGEVVFFVPKRYSNLGVTHWKPVPSLLESKVTWAILAVCFVIALIVVLSFAVNPAPLWLLD